MKITAICGWAISPAWFGKLVEKYLPNGTVKALYPSRPCDPQEARDLLRENKADLYIGHSLGSLWLLHHRQFLPFASRKALLAPILSFNRENKMGGKIPSGQLKYLIKMLTRANEDSNPLDIFFKLCNIPPDSEMTREVPDSSILISGLEFLDHVSVTGEVTNDFIAIIGDNDPFVDSGELRRHIPQLETLLNTGHTPEQLIKKLSQCLAERP